MEIAMQVTVVESHAIPGGAAHAWVQNGYHFESGPSLYSGMAAKCGPHFVPASAWLLVLTCVTISASVHLFKAPCSHTGPLKWKSLALSQYTSLSLAHIAAELSCGVGAAGAAAQTPSRTCCRPSTSRWT